jgi:hypothetical protein
MYLIFVHIFVIYLLAESSKDEVFVMCDFQYKVATLLFVDLTPADLHVSGLCDNFCTICQIFLKLHNVM